MVYTQRLVARRYERVKQGYWVIRTSSSHLSLHSVSRKVGAVCAIARHQGRSLEIKSRCRALWLRPADAGRLELPRRDHLAGISPLVLHASWAKAHSVQRRGDLLNKVVAR